VRALLAQNYKARFSIQFKLKILIAEDESYISMQYYIVLNERGHKVILTDNGEDCLSQYLSALKTLGDTDPGGTPPLSSAPPFDLVILDYRMPKKDGLATARDIFQLCPSQRLMFASAYTAQTMMEAVKNLHRVVELLQKPFDLEYFVDAVEDKALYAQLERLNLRLKATADRNITHSQLVGLLSGVEKLQKLVIDG
jgi:two-component system cell cycle response regulator CpdR